MSGLGRLRAAVLISLALSCGACKQSWQFALPDPPPGSTDGSVIAGGTAGAASGVSQAQNTSASPPAAGELSRPAAYPPPSPAGDGQGMRAYGGEVVGGGSWATTTTPGGNSAPIDSGVRFVSGGFESSVVPPVEASGYREPIGVPPQQSPLQGTSFDAPQFAPGAMPPEAVAFGPAQPPPGGALFEPSAQPPPEPVPAEPSSRLATLWAEAKYDVGHDYLNYYSWSTFRDLGLGLAIAAPLANTPLDQHFRNWYQRDVRSTSTDHAASVFKNFGEAYLTVPAFAALAVTGRYFQDVPLLGPAGDYGGQVTRAYMVGAPPMLFLQYALGATRPGLGETASYWRPFQADHGVSGHAFVGSVPFLTAANMVENPWAKGTLYILSTATAWSRINDDAHYLSQACLGWWMGYLACRAVNTTQQENAPLTLTPIASPDMVGIGLIYQR